MLFGGTETTQLTPLRNSKHLARYHWQVLKVCLKPKQQVAKKGPKHHMCGFIHVFEALNAWHDLRLEGLTRWGSGCPAPRWRPWSTSDRHRKEGMKEVNLILQKLHWGKAGQRTRKKMSLDLAPTQTALRHQMKKCKSLFTFRFQKHQLLFHKIEALLHDVRWSQLQSSELPSPSFSQVDVHLDRDGWEDQDGLGHKEEAVLKGLYGFIWVLYGFICF